MARKNKNDDAWLKERMAAFEKTEAFIKDYSKQQTLKKKYPVKYRLELFLNILKFLFVDNFLIRGIYMTTLIGVWLLFLIFIRDNVAGPLYIILCFVPLIGLIGFTYIRT